MTSVSSGSPAAGQIAAETARGAGAEVGRKFLLAGKGGLNLTHEGALSFLTPAGPVEVRADATILALGGASWPKLGSDGAWVPFLEQRVGGAPIGGSRSAP